MGIKVAEFFGLLSLEGSDKTLNDLKKTKDSFTEIKGVATETKLAILAVIYGIDRMVTSYGLLGTQIKNFSTVTGVSSRILQEYQFAARQAGISNEALTESFLNVQKQMFDIQAGKGVPDWFPTIMTALKNAGRIPQGETVSDLMQHPEKYVKMLSDFAQMATIPVAVRTQVLENAGISPEMIPGLERGIFNQGNLDRGAAMAFTNQQIEGLNRLNIEWTNLQSKVSKFFGTLVAQRGFTDFVHDLSTLTTNLIRIGDALDRIGNKLKVFSFIHEGIGKDIRFFGALADILEGKRKSGLSGLAETLPYLTNPVAGLVPSKVSQATAKKEVQVMATVHNHISTTLDKLAREVKKGSADGILHATAQLHSTRAQ